MNNFHRKKFLDPRPARPLTRREIAKVISGVWGSMCGFCELKEILDAYDHFVEFSEEHKDVFRQLSDQARFNLERAKRMVEIAQRRGSDNP